MITRYLFPLAFMLNAFAMTGILIILGLTGNNAMAAEVGIVQAATIALFYAFSANARSLMLNQQSPVDSADILYIRMMLLLPLSVAAYYLSTAAIEVELLLVVALILRRAVEWLQEVHLSKAELAGDVGMARQYVIYQSVLLVLLVVWIIFGLPELQILFMVWAIFPLLFELKYIVRELGQATSQLRVLGQKLIPHLGSSLIIGISVYVFRLLIILITGKEIAGDLFTAFAIGGTFGSIFANALGASVALNEARSGVRHFPKWVNAGLCSFALLGLLIFSLAWFETTDVLLAFKSYFFFEALGLSMIGGTLMVYAQRLRFRLLLNDSEHDVFGPDVLINLLVITAIPLIAYTLGKENLILLYLLSAALSLVFYLSAKYENSTALVLNKHPGWFAGRLSVISALLVVPVFFQLDSGIFRDKSNLFDHGGVLMHLPIPISLLACFVGVLMLAQYKKAIQSFGVIFFTSILLIIPTLIITPDHPFLQRVKFFFLIQFLLPMFGLALGQMFGMGKVDAAKVYVKGFFIVLAVVVPWQLAMTFINDRHMLTPYLGIFSIYQHLDYVPVIFSATFILLLPKLWDMPNVFKASAVLLGFLLAIYISKSLSDVAPWMLIVGAGMFIWMRCRTRNDKTIGVLLVAVLCGFLLASMNNHSGNNLPDTSDQVQLSLDKGNEARLAAPQQSHEYFIKDIFTSYESFFFGHAERPARTQGMNSKNYYMDLAFNFGVLALLPILGLLLYTFHLVKRSWTRLCISIDDTLLLLVVLFLVVIDNSVQVGLRQPYPGIFTFFLWGLLIARLQQINNKKP